MRNLISFPVLVGLASFAFASTAFAGAVGAPAPVLGAGLPGLAVLAVAGAGYVAMRMKGRGRD